MLLAEIKNLIQRLNWAQLFLLKDYIDQLLKEKSKEVSNGKS